MQNLSNELAWKLFKLNHNADPGIVAGALSHAIERGWARSYEPDDWREGVSGDEPDAKEVLTAKVAFRYLMGAHCRSGVERLAVARALAGVPAGWKERAVREIEMLIRNAMPSERRALSDIFLKLSGNEQWDGGEQEAV